MSKNEAVCIALKRVILLTLSSISNPVQKTVYIGLPYV